VIALTAEAEASAPEVSPRHDRPELLRVLIFSVPPALP
jgi:hypothetical protein